MTISLASLVAPSDAPRDLAPALVRASAALRDGGTLVFPEGEWRLGVAGAAGTTLGITNHDLRPRLTALHLRGRRDIRLDGRGCVLLAEGVVCPVVLEDCAGVTLEGLTLDRAEPLNVCGEILSCSDDVIEVALAPAGRTWGAWAGDLFITATHWRHRVESLFEWDPATRAPAAGSGDNLGGWHHHWVFESPAPGRVLVRGRSRHRPRPGHVLMFRTLERPAPALTLSGCREVRLADVRIHAAGGMGLIAQRCRDVTVVSCATGPSPRGEAPYADLDDATHFANCAGTITIERCTFEGQLDDATNVHGAWFPILRRLDARTLLVERHHPQQAGAPVGGPGDTFALCHRETVEEYARGEVATVHEPNPHCALVEFRAPLPDALAPGDVLDNLTWHPRAVLRGNVIRRNRARGFLLSSREPVLVEDNTFELPGAALIVAGWLNSWCESGPATSVHIRRNRFLRCGTEPMWAEAVLEAGPPATAAARRAEPFVRGLVVEDNTFDLAPGTAPLRATGTAPVVWQRNTGAPDPAGTPSST